MLNDFFAHLLFHISSPFSSFWLAFRHSSNSHGARLFSHLDEKIRNFFLSLLCMSAVRRWVMMMGRVSAS
jgi:hypothetical protein